jgi:methylated-DNA-[protein]-cysteine S-methyltransferase
MIVSNKQLSSGPKISLTIHLSQGLIQRVTMENSLNKKGLSCSIIQDTKAPKAEELIWQWLALYSEGKPKLPSLPFSMQDLSPFTKRTLLELYKVPFGATLTYKDLATKASQPRGARAVGNACRINPFPLFIPCHRVIRSNGQIGKFAFTSFIKKHLLEFEASISLYPALLGD